MSTTTLFETENSLSPFKLALLYNTDFITKEEAANGRTKGHYEFEEISHVLILRLRHSLVG